ncbi:MAG: signal recognition particle-docking protein FtsY [Planctomycetes bacterium]|nr:signal recognition particle-docking protein FtsY [Planctomycetota bacterium]MBI3846933.1 signal recognition particle-docking protein FtsY [Planctomycetota bacterium]
MPRASPGDRRAHQACRGALGSLAHGRHRSKRAADRDLRARAPARCPAEGRHQRSHRARQEVLDEELGRVHQRHPRSHPHPVGGRPRGVAHDMAFGLGGALGKLRAGLQKTREKLSQSLKGLFAIGRKLDQDLIDELEEKLIAADMGPATATQIIDEVKAAYKARAFKDPNDVYVFLKDKIRALLGGPDAGGDIRFAATPPTVVLVVGVNGSGKTTSIAKLASILTKEKKKVLLAACDTFRAAAVEQLEIWSQRIGVEIIKAQTGADPAAVAFDAADAAVARKVDVLLVDTAGRLHTKENLMQELGKIQRVIKKKLPDAPHEVLLVLDATTGQNAIAQAKTFREVVDVTGLFLAKLDGTAKGGVVIGIRNEVGLPVKFVGVGETPDDVERFDPDAFAEALFE